MGLVALVLATLGGAGCGGNSERAADIGPAAPVLGRGLPPEVDHPVAEAIDRLQRAFVKRDYAGVCAYVTPAAARYAGTAAHGVATTCEHDMRRLFGLIRKGGGWRHAGAPRVVDVDVKGAAATATVALDSHWRARVPLVRRDGYWRLSGFFGAAPDRADEVFRSNPDAGFPPAGREPIEVTGADGAPCPELSEAGYPRLSGGCEIDVRSRIAPLTILTPLGDFEFERCSIDFRVRVDASGRTSTEEFQVDGNRKSVACGDVNGCYEASTKAYTPWRGRIYADGEGSFVHRMDMCLSTCVGFFVGELELRLSRDDRGWRAEPVDGGGTTGIRFGQRFDVSGRFDLR